jgi:hypothetical protein
MKKVIFGLSVILLSTALYATLGFLKGEKVSGMNKMCFYDVLGSTYTLNVKSYELCPLSHEF